MNNQEEVPPLNPWPFLIGDAILLATAVLIGLQAHAPLNGLPLIAIASCVALGALLAVIPFLLNYTRSQELALEERQREIAALAQSTATSAEQISIAAASLHSIAENTIRSIKLGEQLPQKIQEKINEFKSQLNEVAVTENEALAQEINTLRTSETERLETALANVRKTAADLAAIESANRQHTTAMGESLTRFVAATEKAASETTIAIENARTAAEKSLAGTLAELDRRIAKLTEQLPAPTTSPTPSAEAKPNLELESKAEPQNTTTPPPPDAKQAASPPPADAVKNESVEPAKKDPASEAIAAAVPTEEKPARKRAHKKLITTDNELTLGFEMPADEFAQKAPEDSAPAVSADGLTRLLVTAYIGIGNKLYLRGEGPGLSWDRGVPLQFVSIGKWRWETDDATAPVTLELYKNDEHPCPSVGTVTLVPGHQHEVSANFS